MGPLCEAVQVSSSPRWGRKRALWARWQGSSCTGLAKARDPGEPHSGCLSVVLRNEGREEENASSRGKLHPPTQPTPSTPLPTLPQRIQLGFYTHL